MGMREVFFSGVAFNDSKFAAKFSNLSAWLCARMSASSRFSRALMLNDKLSSAEKDCCKIRLAVKDLVFTWRRKLSVAGKLAFFAGEKQFFWGPHLGIESKFRDATELCQVFTLDL